MKNLCLYFIILISCLLMGCEDVIDVKLPDNKPSIVIDANLTNKLEIQVVTISETKSFSDNNDVKPISSAKVEIIDSKGNVLNFEETNNGYYTSPAFKGIPGETYTLKVALANKIYTANSKMPIPISVDSLSQTELALFGEKRKFVKVHYQDPKDIQNFYMYRLFINGVKNKGYYVDSDRFNDGKLINNTLFIDEPDLKTGDTVMVDTRGITEKSYRYYFSITQITGNGGPPTTPANPDTNIQGGAFGFFNTSTSTVDTIIIK